MSQHRRVPVGQSVPCAAACLLVGSNPGSNASEDLKRPTVFCLMQ